ncbi:MAG: hypothetical protein ACO1N0_10555 [Fluviicola sp.]
MKFTLVLFVLAFITAGCSQLEKLELKEYPITPVTRENYKLLNGRYSNLSDTACGTFYNNHFNDSKQAVSSSDLMKSLTRFKPSKPLGSDSNGLVKPVKEWVNIEFVSAKKATVSFYRNERVCFSKTIRGKFKSGYFYRRPKWYFVPFVPLFFGYKNEQLRIGKSGDQLLVDHYDNSFLFLLVGGGWNKECTKSVYSIPKNE